MRRGPSGPGWGDPEAWSALCSGTSCPICAGGTPHDILADFPSCWVTAAPVAPLPGYVVVVSKRHVVEPFQLTPVERLAFWEDTMAAAQALADLLRPVKMNYEVHGNTIPHLHMHIYPRFPGDPFEGRPIDPRNPSFSRSQDDLARMRGVLAEAATRRSAIS